VVGVPDGVGAGVPAGVAVGVGVGSGVGVGESSGMGLAASLGLGVGFGVGSGVGFGVGRSDGRGVATGPIPPSGVAVATSGEGAGLPLGSALDGPGVSEATDGAGAEEDGGSGLVGGGLAGTVLGVVGGGEATWLATGPGPTSRPRPAAPRTAPEPTARATNATIAIAWARTAIGRPAPQATRHESPIAAATPPSDRRRNAAPSADAGCGAGSVAITPMTPSMNRGDGEMSPSAACRSRTRAVRATSAASSTGAPSGPASSR
jgi:hypothetical protein